MKLGKYNQSKGEVSIWEFLYLYSYFFNNILVSPGQNDPYTHPYVSSRVDLTQHLQKWGQLFQSDKMWGGREGKKVVF